jgi:hypothetical protein
MKKTNLQMIGELLNGCGEIESLGSPKCKYGCLCHDCLITVETWKIALEMELKFLRKLDNFEIIISGKNYLQFDNSISDEISDIKASLDKLKEAGI